MTKKAKEANFFFRDSLDTVSYFIFSISFWSNFVPLYLVPRRAEILIILFSQMLRYFGFSGAPNPHPHFTTFPAMLPLLISFITEKKGK